MESEWKSKIKLDVGCGSNPTGDINVDFYTGGWNKQEGDQKQGEFLDRSLIPNFVIAHAEYLPFKNECFDVVYSSHVIEHVKNPLNMLTELLRVSSRKVLVRCPHRKGSGARRPFHINYFDLKWFEFSLSKLGCLSRVSITNFECIFTSRFLLHSTARCPRLLLPYVEASIAYRIVRKVERSVNMLRLPFEIVVQVCK